LNTLLKKIYKIQKIFCNLYKVKFEGKKQNIQSWVPRNSVIDEITINNLTLTYRGKKNISYLTIGLFTLADSNPTQAIQHYVIKFSVTYGRSVVFVKLYCIYQYFMSINSFFNTVSVSRYSRPITVTCDPLWHVLPVFS
jgi:hypothetical protein